MAYRLTAELAAREEEWIRGDGSSRRGDEEGGTAAGSTTGAGTATAGAAGGGLSLDEEEAREAVFHRLETLGYRVGLGVVER